MKLHVIGIAGLVFIAALITPGCKKNDASSASAKPTFIMIHFEAGYKACKNNDLPPGLISAVTTTDDLCLNDLSWQEYFWPTAVALVEKADEHGYKLTLAFTPEWGQIIGKDTTRLDLVRQWKKEGHEIAFHHHSFGHRDWDGYSNGTDAQNDPLYKGEVNLGFSDVAALASPDDIISSVMGSLPVDYPSSMNAPRVVFGQGDASNSYSALGPVRSLVPIETQMPDGLGGNRTVVALTIRDFSTVIADELMQISGQSALLVLEDEYRNMQTDDVFGIVWHEYDYYKSKDSYIQWFDFIKANGNSVKTMNEIASEYFK